MQKFLLIWRLPLLWALLIFLGSSIPSLKVTEDSLLQNIINITGHLVEYFVLTYLVIRSYRQAGLSGTKLVVYSFVFALIYAISDEAHQYLVPGRMMDIKDIIIDSVGAITAIWSSKDKSDIVD